MPYDYQEQKSAIFSDAGQRMFLKIRDHAKELLEKAGAVRCQEMMAGAGGGDSWNMLACVDRLVELGEIREIPQERCAGQDRVFVLRHNAEVSRGDSEKIMNANHTPPLSPSGSPFCYMSSLDSLAEMWEESGKVCGMVCTPGWQEEKAAYEECARDLREVMGGKLQCIQLNPPENAERTHGANQA